MTCFPLFTADPLQLCMDFAITYLISSLKWYERILLLWKYEKYRLMQRRSEIFALKAAKVIENHIKNVVRGENRGSKGISITGPCFLLIC